MSKTKSREDRRNVRHKRIRRKLRGTSGEPRLSVFKSTKHIYAQVIDDIRGHTLAAASSLTPDVKERINGDPEKREIAKIVGEYLAELCLSEGIKSVRFDRGGFPFHGRVKALADGAREGGLEF